MNERLLSVLKHGYSYTITEGEETIQQLQAPNKYMREAADEIINLINQNNRMSENYWALIKERDSLIQELEILREQSKSIQVPNPDSPVS